MIVKYKYGFEHKGKLYAWKNKDLYRLPQMIGKRFYSLKKCGKWIDKKDVFRGYYLGDDRKSHDQLESMTHFINHEEEVIKDSDCPF